MILTDTQTAIRDLVRDFAQAEIRPHSAASRQQAATPLACSSKWPNSG